MGKIIDLVGQRFGKLTVTGLDPVRSKNGTCRWICSCDCGGSAVVLTENIKRGHTSSCGCAAKEAHTTHGDSKTPEYRVWANMLRRCQDQDNPNFKHYGARGIRVCPQWQTYEGFIADMGYRPSPDHSIERCDVNGNYEPANCYWATIDVQNSNRTDNVVHTVNGQRMTNSEVARLIGITPTAVAQRLARGLTIEEVLAAGKRAKQRKRQAERKTI